MTESAVYVMEKMAHGFKRMGKAAERGFYDYDFDPPQLWSGLKTFERRGKALEVTDISERLLIAAALSALRMRGAPDLQVASILGARIPANATQAQAWVDSIGLRQFATRCEGLSQRFGSRFNAPAAGSAQ